MLELWVRMEDLFPNLWSATNGLAQLENKKFETWCRKLTDLSLEDFGRAFSRLEDEIAAARNTGQKIYPPSYAEFLGLTRAKPGDAITAQQAAQASTTLPNLLRDRSEKTIAKGRAALHDMMKGL